MTDQRDQSGFAPDEGHRSAFYEPSGSSFEESSVRRAPVADDWEPAGVASGRSDGSRSVPAFAPRGQQRSTVFDAGPIGLADEPTGFKKFLLSTSRNSLMAGLTGGLLAGVMATMLVVGYIALADPSRATRYILLAVTVPAMVVFAARWWPDLVAGNRLGFDASVRSLVAGAAAGAIGMILADWFNYAFVESIQDRAVSGREYPAGGQVTFILVAGFAMVAAAVAFGVGVATSVRRACIGALGALVGGAAAGAILVSQGGSRELEVGALWLSIPFASAALGAAIGGAEMFGRRVWVSIIDGELAGRQINLYANPATIGSGPGADVQLTGDEVRDRHASIVRHRDLIWIDAIDPAAEVRVNQAAIAGRKQVAPNDVINIGRTFMKIQVR